MAPQRRVASLALLGRSLGQTLQGRQLSVHSRGSFSSAHSYEPAEAADGQQLKEAGCGSQVGHGAGGREAALPMRSPPEQLPFAVRALSHVSLAVPDVARAAEHFRTLLGAQVSEILEIPEKGVAVSAVHVGNACLMLMQPLPMGGPSQGNSGLVDFLEKQPEGGIHHLSFTVDNLSAAKEHLASEGVALLRDSASGRTIHMGVRNNPVLCLHPESVSGVMLELEQVSFGRSSHRIT